MSAFIFSQYTDSPAKYFIFLMPIILLCNYSSICFCNRKGLLFFCSSHQCLQSLPLHFLLASSVSSCVPLHPFLWHIYQCTDDMDVYDHAMDFLVPDFCMVVPRQPFCNLLTWAQGCIQCVTLNHVCSA